MEPIGGGGGAAMRSRRDPRLRRGLKESFPHHDVDTSTMSERTRFFCALCCGRRGPARPATQSWLLSLELKCEYKKLPGCEAVAAVSLT